jgi:hypothetical protein
MYIRPTKFRACKSTISTGTVYYLSTGPVSAFCSSSCYSNHCCSTGTQCLNLTASQLKTVRIAAFRSLSTGSSETTMSGSTYTSSSSATGSHSSASTGTTRTPTTSLSKDSTVTCCCRDLKSDAFNSLNQPKSTSTHVSRLDWPRSRQGQSQVVFTKNERNSSSSTAVSMKLRASSLNSQEHHAQRRRLSQRLTNKKNGDDNNENCPTLSN